jgi:chromosome segregation ATPase
LQGEQTTKGHELLQLRGQTRDLKAELERQEAEVDKLREEMKSRDVELVRLQRLTTELEETNLANKRHQEDADSEVLRLKADISRLKDQLVEVVSANKFKLEASELEVSKLRADMLQMEKALKTAQTVAKCSYEVCNCKTQQSEKETREQDDELIDSGMENHLTNDDVRLGKIVERLREELSEERKEFEQERVIWAQEKEKVLRYQRQLQLNYVQMFRRTKSLEAEVESLTLELELETKTGRGAINHTGKKQLPAIDMAHTIEL